MKINKLFIVAVLLSVAVGLVGGYEIWGKKETGKTDMKQLLKQINKEVEGVDKKNQELAAALAAAKAESEGAVMLQKEKQDLEAQLQHALQQITEKESALAELQAKAAEGEQQAEAEKELLAQSEELKVRTTILENENQDLIGQVQKAQQDITDRENMLNKLQVELSEARKETTQGEEQSTLGKDLQKRISALEKENQELKAVFNTISELTQKKEEAQEAAEPEKVQEATDPEKAQN